jgi:hypothetical protein
VEPNPETTPEIVTPPSATVEADAGWAPAVEGKPIPGATVAIVGTATLFLTPNI